MKSAVGDVPDIVGTDNGGGPWGIDFTEAQFAITEIKRTVGQNPAVEIQSFETDIAFTLQTWTGPDAVSLAHIAAADDVRVLDEHLTTSGINIDLSVFSFKRALEGGPAAALMDAANTERKNAVYELRLKIEIKPLGAGAFQTSGTFAATFHRDPPGGQEPYILDYQFRKGLGLNFDAPALSGNDPIKFLVQKLPCLLYTSPSPRD